MDPTVYAGLWGRGEYGSHNVGSLIGVYGEGPPGGQAAHFRGSVYVEGGSITVAPATNKSAAVPHPDGSLRLLYSLECPESWFEDFGRAEVTEGYARVELDRDFAVLVRTEDYHISVTPEGDSNGLYVSARTPREFEVREQGGGTSTLAFNYRVVARRKDVEPDRLGVFEPPPERTPAELEPDELEPPTEWGEQEQQNQ